MYKTKAQLIVELTALEANITKAESGASWSTGLGDSLTRPPLQVLYNRKDKLIKEIERIDAASTGGIFIKAKFKAVS